MGLLKQIGLAMVLVACAAVGVARYYPGSHVMLERLGFTDDVLAIVAKQQDTATGETGGGPAAGGRGGPPASVVTTTPVFTGVISTKVQAIGTTEALRSVSVVPMDTGVLTEVAVSSGDVVKAGDVLARMDSETEEIIRDRAAVTLKTAESSYARYEALIQSNATSQAELETLLSARDDAALALREAEVELQQRTVFAPIGGSVGIVPVEIGDYVDTATEIVLIDDRVQVVIDFWVPERFAGIVAIGQPVMATSLALSGTAFTGHVKALGSRIETDSRTLQVRALINNPDDILRPGMSFSIAMAFDGETYPAVDPLAVQWDADGSYVWTVVDGVASRVPAIIVQRNADAVLIDADIAEGTNVITEGTLNVRNGAAVIVQGAAEPDNNVTASDKGRPSPTPQTPSAAEG